MEDLVEEMSDEVEADEFESTNFRAISYTEIDDRLLNALGAANDKITSITTNEFVVDAYIAATSLRNLLGDGDAHAADLSESIRMNLLVASLAIKNSPAEFIIAASKTVEDEDGFIFSVIDTLMEYRTALRLSKGEIVNGTDS